MWIHRRSCLPRLDPERLEIGAQSASPLAWASQWGGSGDSNGTAQQQRSRPRFAGSGFYVEEETGKQHYRAESGDLICVSNFGSATLDLPVESSQAAAGLLFEALTERVPALGTPVRLVLEPKLDEAASDNGTETP